METVIIKINKSPKRWLRIAGLMWLLSVMLAASFLMPARQIAVAQQPTSSMATVTGTPIGAVVTILPGQEEQVNVRSGPGTFYPKVGVLLVGQSVPAKGRSPKGEWILVDYPGVPGGMAWIYAPYVKIVPPTDLPIMEPPATPTPLYTATIDPTLAAKYVITLAPTRLPSFTAPPPLIISTYQPETGAALPGGLPMGVIIIGLAAIGAFLGVVALLQR